jgi:hypothetical protein
MPTVSVLIASKAGVQHTAQPGDSFTVVLQQSRNAAEAATGLQLQPIAVMFSSSNLPVPGWQEPQRAMGSEDVTVVMQAAPLGDVLSSLMSRMTAMQHEMSQSVTALSQSVISLAGPRISNCAAQILLHAAGESFRPTTCSRYTAMGESHSAIQQLSSLTGKKASTIVAKADDVIYRRNNVHVHFLSAAALEADVQQCAQLIAANPNLRQQQKWECWVIENFANFKVAFSPIFGA